MQLRGVQLYEPTQTNALLCIHCQSSDYDLAAWILCSDDGIFSLEFSVVQAPPRTPSSASAAVTLACTCSPRIASCARSCSAAPAGGPIMHVFAMPAKPPALYLRRISLELCVL